MSKDMLSKMSQWEISDIVYDVEEAMVVQVIEQKSQKGDYL